MVHVVQPARRNGEPRKERHKVEQEAGLTGERFAPDAVTKQRSIEPTGDTGIGSR